MKAHHLPLPVSHARARRAREVYTRRELLMLCAACFLCGAVLGAIIFGEALLAAQRKEQARIERILK